MRDDEQTFKIEIDKAKSVSDLRKVIKKETRARFHDIPADSLRLWSHQSRTQRRITRSIRRYFGLVSYEILSEDLEKNAHIIIDRPQSGELQLPISLLSF